GLALPPHGRYVPLLRSCVFFMSDLIFFSVLLCPNGGGRTRVLVLGRGVVRRAAEAGAVPDLPRRVPGAVARPRGHLRPERDHQPALPQRQPRLRPVSRLTFTLTAATALTLVDSTFGPVSAGAGIARAMPGAATRQRPNP